MAGSDVPGGGTPVTLVVSSSAVTPTPTATPGVVATPPRKPLAFTGFDLGTALVLTSLLLVVGVLFLVSGRRTTLTSRST